MVVVMVSRAWVTVVAVSRCCVVVVTVSRGWVTVVTTVVGVVVTVTCERSHFWTLLLLPAGLQFTGGRPRAWSSACRAGSRSW